MKRFVPLLAAVAALAAVAFIAVVAVGASDDGSPEGDRQEDATDGDVAAACLEGAEDCDDTVGLDDSDSMNMCIDDPDVDNAVEECNDMIDGASGCGPGADCVDAPAARCIAPPDNPGAAEDGVAIPECNDLFDCTVAESECVDVMPVEPGIAVDPICIDDGTGVCMDTPNELPPWGPLTTYDLTIVFGASVTQGDIDETVKVITSISTDTEFLVRESFPPVGVARITTGMLEFCADLEAKLESSGYIDDVTCAASITPDGNPPADPDAPVSSEPGAAE